MPDDPSAAGVGWGGVYVRSQIQIFGKAGRGLSRQQARNEALTGRDALCAGAELWELIGLLFKGRHGGYCHGVVRRPHGSGVLGEHPLGEWGGAHAVAPWGKAFPSRNIHTPEKHTKLLVIQKRMSFPFQEKSQLFQKLLGCHLAGFAERYPLDHIDSSLSPQNVTHRGLTYFQFLGELLLGQTRVTSDSGHYL